MMQIRDDISIRQELEEKARTEPDRVYLIFEDVPVTVAEMNWRVNRLANGMAKLGLKQGDRVAVMLPNHPDHIYVFLACTKLGVIQVPVNAHLRGASLEYLIEHAEPRALIADTIYTEQLLPALARLPPRSHQGPLQPQQSR